MHILDVIFFVGIAICVLITLLMRSIHGRGVDAYSAWVAEIKVNTPDFQEPWLADGARNPRWREGQTITHTDGTVYTFPPTT